MVDTSLDSFHFYFLVAVLQGFVLAGLIVFRKPIGRANVYVGVLVFLISLSLLHGVLEQSIHAFNARFLFPLEYGFLLGPLIYFHIRQVVDPDFSISVKAWHHFIPSLILDILLYVIFFSYVSRNSDWAEANLSAIQLIFFAVAILFAVHISLYIFGAYRCVQKASIKPKEYMPTVKRWSAIFIGFWIATPVLMIITILWAVLNIRIFDDNAFMVYNPVGILKAICIYSIGYIYLLKYVPLLNKYVKDHERTLTVRHSPEEIFQKQQQLKRALEQGEVYKDEKLTVNKLARHLGWPESEVSQIIGEVFDSNFNDLVNSYRVQAFKDLVVKPENQRYSIMGLAEKAGFNSKTSFYRAFKKECGQTPSEYLALINPPKESQKAI